MALTIGGKRRKPGGGPPAVPLTPTESRLVNRLVSTMNTLSDAFDVEQYAEAIRNLDPDLLEQLLNDVNIDELNVLIDDTLRDVVMDQASTEARKVIRNAPRTGNSPFLDLNYVGEVLPSGIIIPTPEMVEAPDVQFYIKEPVDRMFRFVSQRATDYASTRSATLVRQIDESNRLAIREVITRAFTEPRTVDETARALRHIVGLHPRWARAVERFNEKNLVRLVREGMSSRQAQETANRMTERYRKKLIRRRAEMIARTEIQQAQNYARQTSWEATESLGLVDPRSEKEWRTALATSRYGPPCDVCAPLNGTRVPWNGVFDNGRSMPPAHPNCRCTAVLIPPTRGLTGLPSQNMQPWIDRLDELETEAIESIEMVSDVVVKHQQGSHDQKTHGSWATGGAVRWIDALGSGELKNTETGDQDSEYLRGVKDQFNKTWEESLGIPGATVETDVRFLKNYGIKVESVATAPNGDKIFNAERTIKLLEQPGTAVSHLSFYVEPEYQGKGIATRANQKFFDLYRENGMTQVTLQANADVGGYTWAKQGFDWRNDFAEDTRSNFSAMKRMLRKAEQLTSIKEVGYDVGTSDFYNSLRQDRPDEWPTPLEIAMYGHTKGATTWPGKEAMLGDDWEGVLRL